MWPSRRFADSRGAEGGDLVEAVVGVNDPGAARCPAREGRRRGDRSVPGRRRRAIDAWRGRGWSSGPSRLKIVGIPRCFAGIGDEFHRRMMRAGKRETDVGAVQASAEIRRGDFQLEAEFFQNVGRAAIARGGAVAVLDDFDPRAGGDEGGGGGDVERMADVAAGAAGVEDDRHAVAVDGDDFFAHDGGRADEFIDGGSLGGESDEEPADLRLGRLAGHDVQKRRSGFVAGEVLAPAEFQEDIAEGAHEKANVGWPYFARPSFLSKVIGGRIRPILTKLFQHRGPRRRGGGENTRLAVEFRGVRFMQMLGEGLDGTRLNQGDDRPAETRRRSFAPRKRL